MQNFGDQVRTNQNRAIETAMPLSESGETFAYEKKLALTLARLFENLASAERKIADSMTSWQPCDNFRVDGISFLLINADHLGRQCEIQATTAANAAI